jgi:hypothetical protein
LTDRPEIGFLDLGQSFPIDMATNLHPHSNMKTFYLGILGLCLLSSMARADAVNENRILRKAGGESKGSINLRITTIPYSMGMPDAPVVSNTTRTGDVKIPTGEGNASSVVDHESAPGPLNDTTTAGKVKKAVVSRNGSVIKYSGNGNAEPVFDSNGNYTGSAKATSKVRGGNVISTSTFRGSRTVVDGMSVVTEVITVEGDGKGKSKF